MFDTFIAALDNLPVEGDVFALPLGAKPLLRRRTLVKARRIVAVLLATVAGAACGRATPPVALPPAPQSINVVHGDSAAIARARADSAERPYTAADIHFMTGMITHHEQAIVMSKWAPTHGASAQLRTLAARIINSQQDEIALMQQWRRWTQSTGSPVSTCHWS